jgi:hypothetical protein
VERIALAQQAVLRAARLEAAIFSSYFIDYLHEGDQGLYQVDFDRDANPLTLEQHHSLMLAQAFTQYGGGNFSLFLRYQAQAERRYRAAIQEFERLKTLRAEAEMGSFGESLSEPAKAPSRPESEPEAAAPQPQPVAVLPPPPAPQIRIHHRTPFLTPDTPTPASGGA